MEGITLGSKKMLAGDDLGGDVALVDALVGQHRLSDDVADGVNVRDVGPELFVDLGTNPRSVTSTPACSASISLPLGVRPMATRTASYCWTSVPPSLVSNVTEMPSRLRLNGGHLGFQPVLVNVAGGLGEVLDDVLVGGGMT